MADEPTEDRSAAPINVLVVETDQFRWDCLGCAGNPDVRTPHLDEIAAGGVLYANSFCSFPVCTPSRYSLLSGLYVHQHGGWSNRNTLAAGLPTFPRLLRAAGYRTKAVGKMHFTPTYLDAGFEALELAEQDGDGRLDDDYHRELMAHGLADLDDVIDQRREFRQRAKPVYWQTFGAMRSNLPEAWHSTTWIGDHAVRSIEEWDTAGANLLIASFIKPHHPFDPPAPWDTMYDPAALTILPGCTERVPDEDGPPSSGYFPHERLTEAALRRVMAHYYGTISHVDRQVGRMLDALRRRGLYERTMIVFTADHGEYLGFHHLLLKGGRMYEPLARVPLLVRYPGGARAGEIHQGLVSNVDVAPTILRQAGVEPPPVMRGLDLADPTAGRQFVFAEQGRGPHYLVRTRAQKLLLGADRSRTGFYDLEADPYELHDRFDDPAYAEQVQALRDALANWMLFESTTPSYLDPSAPLTGGDNVPRDANAATRDARRRTTLDYYEQHLAKYLAEP